MSGTPQFHTDTSLARALRELLSRLAAGLELVQPLNVYLAGGMAVHLYTASRVTTDVDAEFDKKILLPPDLTIEIELEDGSLQVVYFDANYNPTFALRHENYLEDALPVDIGVPDIKLHILSPTDLAVNKIARQSEFDREDIQALVASGLTSAQEIEARANQALSGYVGGMAMLRVNLNDVLELARRAERAA